MEKVMIQKINHYGRHVNKLISLGYLAVPLPWKSKRPIIKGWHPIEDWGVLQHWKNKYSEDFIGLYTGYGIIAIDIDTECLEKSKTVEKIARKILGDTPLKRIGQSPKLLLVYRCDEGIRKRLYRGPDGDILFEVLGKGQQFVAFNIHPKTGKPYFWPDKSPFEISREELPAVTLAHIIEFENEVEARIPRGNNASTHTCFSDEPVITDSSGKIIDGRNGVGLRIRFRTFLDDPYIELEDFQRATWIEFTSKVQIERPDRSYTWDDWCRLCRSDIERLRKKNGLIDGVDPTFPFNAVTLEEASASVNHLVDTFISNPKHTCIRVTAGVGKTHTAISIIADEVKSNPSTVVHYFVPTNNLGAEVASKFEAVGVSVLHHNGRTETDCQRKEDVIAAGTQGLSVQRYICNDCSAKSECFYQNRLNRKFSVYVFTHEYLVLPMDKRIPPASFQVIDEAFWKVAIHTDEISRSVLNYYGVNLTVSASPNELRHYADCLEGWYELQHMTVPKIIGISAKVLKALPPYPPVELLRHWADDIERHGRVLSFELNAKKETIYTRWLTSDLRLNVPTLILDATADELLYRIVCGEDLQYHRLEVERRGSVQQLWTRQFGKRDLLEGNDRQINISRIQEIIQEASKRHASGLIVTYKKIEKQFSIPKGWFIDHFNNLRGSNAYEKCSVIIVVGRNFPPDWAIRNLAAGVISMRPDIDLDLNSTREKIATGYRMKNDTKKGILDWSWTDPIFNSFQRQLQHEETIQALDRVRGVRQDREIIILSSHCLDLSIDQLFTLKKSKMEKAFELVNGPVLPLGAAWLMTHLPSLFKSKTSAEAFSKIVRANNPRFSYISINRKNGGYYISYRIQGTKGRESIALVRDGTKISDVKQALMKLHQQPVSLRLEAELLPIARGVFVQRKAA
jgi:hypothetical protein